MSVDTWSKGEYHYPRTVADELDAFSETIEITLHEILINDIANQPTVRRQVAEQFANDIALKIQYRVAGKELDRIEWKVPLNARNHVKQSFYHSQIGLWLSRKSSVFNWMKQHSPVKFLTKVFDVRSYYPRIPIDRHASRIVVEQQSSFVDWRREAGISSSGTQHITADYKEYVTCPYCLGSGRIVGLTTMPYGAQGELNVCPSCEGLGSVVSREYTQAEVTSNRNKYRKTMKGYDGEING